MLHHDQRGFVLSGIAILLVLPAMLLAASCFKVIETGGETTSLQALSDKVAYTAHDIERMIKHMDNQMLGINDNTLSALADNYRAATGLLIDIGSVTVYPLWIHVHNTGVDHYAGTKYCRITDVSPGVWYYNFEDLDEELGETVDWDYNEPRLLVEKLDGSIRVTVEEYDGGYHSAVRYSGQLLFPWVGNFVDGIGDTTGIENAVKILVPVSVRDPRNVAQCSLAVELGQERELY